MRATRGHIPGRRGLSGVWYSGWYNGLAKKHALNVPRTKAGIHNVIVYCKTNPDKKIIQAIDLMLKAEKK